MFAPDTLNINNISSVNAPLNFTAKGIDENSSTSPSLGSGYLTTTPELPDLVVTDLKLEESLALVRGSTVNIGYTLHNQGNLSASNITTAFYLSRNINFDHQDTLLGNHNVVFVDEGDSLSQTFSFSIDRTLAEGNYYLIAKADSSEQVVEIEENNNTKAIEINVRPDLIISSFTAPDTLNNASFLSYSYSVRNIGTVNSRNYVLTSLYLSRQGVESAEIKLQDNFTNVISVNNIVSRKSAIFIGNSIAPGNYDLILKVDSNNRLLEGNETNNTVIRTITITDSGAYSTTNGYGLVNASAAVANALNLPALGNNRTSNNWSTNLIKASEVWASGYTGQGVTVAVLDTGVDRTHVDLADNIWTNKGEIAGNGIDDDGNGFVDDIYGWNFADGNNDTMDIKGHGTHVAGTIAAVNNNIGVTGIAYNAKIMPVKVLDDNGSGTLINVAKGIRYAVDNGARVINLSLGGDRDNLELRSAIEYASNRGAIVVMAAGNSGRATTQTSYPAAYAQKWGIVVGAVNSNNILANWSNRAGALQLPYVTAPGVNILSTLPGNKYSLSSGTSMATPHVAGVVALMLSANPKLTDPEVRQILATTAEDSINRLNSTRVSSSRMGAVRS